MNNRRRWWSEADSVRFAVLHATIIFGALLLVARLTSDGWGRGLGFAALFAGVWLLFNLAHVWNNRPVPQPDRQLLSGG